MKRIIALGLGAAAAGLAPAPATAQVGDYYIGQIILVSGYCPKGTIEADGRLIGVEDNLPLFTLIGTVYGGDGTNDFALPDLRARVPIGVGGENDLGEAGGDDETRFGNVPHDHGLSVLAVNGTADTDSPTNASLATFGPGLPVYRSAGSPAVPMRDAIRLSGTGQGSPAITRSPVLGMRYCVVTQGYLPQF